jgi:hypothetical protein
MIALLNLEIPVMFWFWLTLIGVFGFSIISILIVYIKQVLYNQWKNNQPIDKRYYKWKIPRKYLWRVAIDEDWWEYVDKTNRTYYTLSAEV